MRIYNPQSKSSRFWQISLVCALGAFQMSSGQNEDITDEDIYELSPFVVDSSEDQGYNATSTLAGTRIRTSLKDIGTSIQVVTKDFMNDIGADDADSLLNYTTNTEIGGAMGNYSGNDASDPNVSTMESRGNPQSTTRVRGLFRADLTRNYFKSLIPFDGYNTSSVDINRGSNATLFGLGSPAGIINNTLDAPYFGNGGDLSIRLDDFGSYRASLNYNHEVFEDKLAVRVAGLKDNRKYYQDPTYQNQDRYYVAAQWKIRPNTKLKVNYEKGKTDANRPDMTSPIESITPWLLMGKRILDSGIGTGIGFQGRPTGIKVDKDGDGILDDVYSNEIYANRIYDYMQYGDGSFVNEGRWTWNSENQHINAPAVATIPGAERGTTGGVGQPQIWGQGTIIFGDPTSSDPTIPGFKAQYAGNENYAGDALSLLGDGEDPFARWMGINNISGFFNNWKPQGFKNLNGFDWGKRLLGGTTANQSNKFDAYNVTLEQTFFNNKMGFEVAFDKQTFDYDFFTPLQLGNTGQIKVDLNVRLPDGRMNPNVGRPYMISRNFRMFRENELETKRFTAFIEHDFADDNEGNWLRWLGRHTLTGLYDQNKEESNEFRAFQLWDDVDLRRVLRVRDNAMDMNHFSSRVFPIVYVGPSLLNYDVNSIDDVVFTPPSGLKLWQPGRTVPFTYWDPGQTTPGNAAKDEATVVSNGELVTRQVAITTAFTEKSRVTKTTTDSMAFVHQGYFLKDYIVTTIGYRKDTVESALYTSPPSDEFSKNKLDAPLSEWGDKIVSEVEEDRWSYGVVAHVPSRWTPWRDTQVSVHYSESSNFSLEPGRINWNNEALGNPGGETEEYGFSVNTLEGKLNMRVNWYETALTNRTSKGFASLLWYNLGKANTYLGAAGESENPVFQDFNRAVANMILDNVTPGEASIYPWDYTYNSEGEVIGLTQNAVKTPVDTDDVVAKGMEVEVTYNPTKNWRMHFNIAKQETRVSNVFPNAPSQLALREKLLSSPVPGFEWLTYGELPTGGKTEENWIIDPVNQVFADLNDPTNTDYDTMRDDFNNRTVNYRTKKASEGSLATEQRKWRFNFVTNYSFSETFKGLSVGGAYRWQDEVAIGFPMIEDADGNSVGDVDHPVYADAQDNVDVFASYKMPYFKQYGDWTIRMQVRNVFAKKDDIIPVQLQGDGVSFSRYRLAPQREIIFTSTFKF